MAEQAENYAVTPQDWYKLWFPNVISLAYLANGSKIYYKNLLTNWDGNYEELLIHHRGWQESNRDILRNVKISLGHFIQIFICIFI